jgi:hypothetical protein
MLVGAEAYTRVTDSFREFFERLRAKESSS